MANFTQKLIIETFENMLERMPLEKITVTALIKECNIGRNTFYYHYEDITALLEEIMMSMVDELIEKYPSVDSLDQGIAVAIEFVLENKTAVMHIYHSNQRPIYERCLMKLCRHVFIMERKIYVTYFA